MSTTESVKAQLQGEIAKANGTTGRTDTNIHDCIDSLIAGYGQSGGSGGSDKNDNFVLLHTETLNSVQSVTIPFESDWNEYDIIYVVPDLTFTDKEYLYYGYNNFSNSSGDYHYVRLTQGGDPKIKKDHAFNILIKDSGWKLVQNITDVMSVSAAINNVCFKLYLAKNKMTGTLKLYGIKL